jgi:hypothetical protein
MEPRPTGQNKNNPSHRTGTDGRAASTLVKRL